MLSILKGDASIPTTASWSLSSSPLNLGSAQSSRSVIGVDLRIVGNLVSSGELQIEGTVQGDVSGVHVIVRETARITGTISGQTVTVQGEVIGSIKADQVVLAGTCKLEGDLFHKSLLIEQGAYFEGRSRRASPEASDTTAKGK